MIRYLLIASLFFLTGCPKENGEQDNPSEPTTPAAWNPAMIWPEISLPDIQPVDADQYMRIPQHAVAIGVDNIGKGDILSHKALSYFVVEPGDYTSLGRIQLTSSGTAEEPRVMYCLDGDCVFDAFELVESDYWVFIGITFKSEQNEKDGVKHTGTTRLTFSDHNLFHDCHWSNMLMGVRIYGNYNTVQYCSFADKPALPFDIGGVGIFARAGMESRGNQIIYNEFKGMVDGAGVPWDPEHDSGSTPATTIAYNTSWIPESLVKPLIVVDEQGNEHEWIWSCAEDGYDIKNGALTDLPEDRSYFIGNVSIGHRPTDTDCGGSAGSAGAGWVFHRRARNWLIQGNLSFDDALGCFVKGYPDKPDAKDRVQNIEIRNNAFLLLGGNFPGGIAGYRENPNDRTGMRVMCPTCRVIDNLVSGAKREIFDGRTDAEFRDNQYYDIEIPVTNKVRPGTDLRQIKIPRSPILDPGDDVMISFRVGGYMQ